MMYEMEHISPVGQQTSYSCGIGALETIFKFYGAKTGKNLHLITKRGSNHSDIRRVARKNGFIVGQIRGTLESVRSQVSRDVPVLVNYQDYGENNGKNGHYAVVVGYSDKKLKLCDPAEGGKEKWMENVDFVARWRDTDAPVDEKTKWAAIVVPKEVGEAMKFKEYVRDISA